LTLTAVSMLGKHLTEDNHIALLYESRHKSKREIEAILGRIRPRPDAIPIVRRLPPGRTLAVAGQACVEDRTTGKPEGHNRRCDGAGSDRGQPRRMHEEQEQALGTSSPPPAPRGEDKRALMHPRPPEPKAVCNNVASRSGPRSDVAQLSQGRYRVQVTIGADSYRKLRRAQDLLRHVVPNGDLEKVFDRAIALLLAELEKTRLGATARPRLPRLAGERAPAKRVVEKPNAAGGADNGSKELPHGKEPERPRSVKGDMAKRGRSRHIAAAVKREVVQRDGARCTFVGLDGNRCRETSLLQFHHRVPFAEGGPTTAANLCLSCKSHNAHEAERWFGANLISLDSTRSRTTSASGATPRSP